jgi:ABC-type sugar transport system substrate-binding protein
MIVDYGAVMGDAIAAYLKAAGRTDILHVTAGATPATGRWLGTPYLAATRYWSAAEVGRVAASTVLTVIRDDEEQADPFVRTVDQQMRTTLRGAPPNALPLPATILPPVPQNEVQPLPTEGPSASDEGPSGP